MALNDETKRKTIIFYPDDLEYLKKFHGDNLQEAIRILIKKVKKYESQEFLIENYQLIIFGVLIIGIALIILQYFDIGVIFLGIGAIIIGFGAGAIVKYIMKGRKLYAN